MKYLPSAAGLCIVLLSFGPALAAQSVIEVVANGCDKEIKAYCKDVTAGEGRILACLYARQDVLSGSCEYALYNAATRLQSAITALVYLENECGADLKACCSDIKPGAGRLEDCVNKNSAKFSSRCKKAMKDAGLK